MTEFLKKYHKNEKKYNICFNFFRYFCSENKTCAWCFKVGIIILSSCAQSILALHLI